MATGITKREQFGKDALTAQDFFLKELPLSPVNAQVELTYPNKVPEANILKPLRTEYCVLNKNGKASETRTTLPDNSFVLTDNFPGLHTLLEHKKEVTLFYLDPPYGTGFDFHSRDLEHAYKDSMGPAAYLEFMRQRLIMMRECMADDGSIYVHIGYQMLSHLKIIMDEIFGQKNFRNVIARRKCNSKNFTRKQFCNLNDYVLFYTRSNNYKWNQPGEQPEQEWIDKEYPKIDQFGRRYKLVPVHAPGTRNGETGKEWRGKKPPPGKHWQYAPSRLDELDVNGDIHWSKNGNPRRKVYWTTDKKLALTDYWKGFRDAHHQSIKITGYPTEKNFEMLKMIVGASSEKGDLVVDPFNGSGTTIAAAQQSERRFIGLDSSFTAAKATIKRFRHGTEAMGDYVNSNNNIEDLLCDKAIKSQELLFVVEKKLLSEHKKEIQELSEI